MITSNDSQHPTTIVPIALTVLNTQAYIFYNNSVWDGENADADVNDDAAIAVDKAPLRSGQKATFANYTSYSSGINGIIIDLMLPDSPTPLSSADFMFRVGNTDNPDTWLEPPVLPTVSIRPGAGLSGSDRVTLIWPDGAIKKQWLQVTVLATSQTGLQTPDVFYFGNAIGETGDTATSAYPDAIVNATDVIATRTNQRSPLNPAPITSPYDFNRDRVVNATDTIICRANQASPLISLRLITAP